MLEPGVDYHAAIERRFLLAPRMAPRSSHAIFIFSQCPSEKAMANLRNPSTTADELNQRIVSLQRSIDKGITKAETERAGPHQYQLLAVFKETMEVFLCRYARGDAIDDLAGYFMTELLPGIRHAQKLTAQYFPEYVLRLHSSERWGMPFVFALVCFDKDGAELRRLDDWVDFELVPPELDILCRAFVPDRPFARKYKLDKNSDKERVPVLRLIVEEDAKRQAALRALLAGWPKVMQPYGYREMFVENRHPFDHFPFAAAMAVCAYDLDDIPFRKTLFYPHEMVTYYCEHIRHTRDAWRGQGVGPGTDLPAIPQLAPKKVYALKPADAYARWIELACGEKPELLAAARQALGKRKSMPELDTVMEALAGAGIGTHADIKDDETLAQQAVEMCQHRSLPEFPLPDAPPQGAARCSAILSRLNAWLPDHGHQLFVIGEGGDAWDAVAVCSNDAPQFIELCEQLEIDIMSEAAWAS